MNAETAKEFIDAWGRMGSLWGINPSVARVHALLMASDTPQGLDAISTRLCISRGNASMCLKELRSWGVVKLVRDPGDRRDFYVSEPDVWRMFFAIATERKRRELNPAVDAVRGVASRLDAHALGPAARRIRQMETLLTDMSHIADRLLSNPERAKMVLSLLADAAEK